MSPAERVALTWRADVGLIPMFAIDALTPEERERVSQISQSRARRLVELNATPQPGDVKPVNAENPATHVIILAQGEQKRLPNLLGYPKQAVRLPWCGDTPLMARTLRQIDILDAGARVTVIAGPILRGLLEQASPCDSVEFVQLPAPGNSSLKGIARYLEGIAYGSDHDRDLGRVVVLLGDVVYSWQCLLVLLGLVEMAGTRTPLRFVGTRDLTSSTGELWGIAWERVAAPGMLKGLSNALEHHPPFDDYQPGQLRRWLWEMNGGSPWRSPEFDCSPGVLAETGGYVAIDDYTRDIDLPEHIEMLPGLSVSAYHDDLKYGLVWSSRTASRQAGEP
jgi:hypothetical protein